MSSLFHYIRSTYLICDPKFFDSETDLYYYGYRYYSGELGVWIIRDPIKEPGSFLLRKKIEEKRADLNLYGFVNNNPIINYDHLGLFVKRCSRELGENTKPKTDPDKLFRHDYLRISDVFRSFQPYHKSGVKRVINTFVMGISRVDDKEIDGGRCYRMICSDDEFDKYVLSAAARYQPPYAIIAHQGSLPYKVGARQCKTWTDDILKMAIEKYIKDYPCQSCFSKYSWDKKGKIIYNWDADGNVTNNVLIREYIKISYLDINRG